MQVQRLHRSVTAMQVQRLRSVTVMQVQRLHRSVSSTVATSLILVTAIGCAGRPSTPYPPLGPSADPLSMMPENTRAVLRVDLERLRTSDLTRPFLDEVLSSDSTTSGRSALLRQLDGAQQLWVGIGPSLGEADSPVLAVATGAFENNDSNQAQPQADENPCDHARHTIASAHPWHVNQLSTGVRLLGDCGSVQSALNRVDGHAPPSPLASSDARWRDELAFDRSAISYVAYQGASRLQGRGWSLPEDWEKVAFSADFAQGLSGRLTAVAASPQAAQRTVADFERLRAQGTQSMAVRVLGLADLFAAIDVRRVASTVTVRLRLTEHEANRVAQRLQLLAEGLQDTLRQLTGAQTP